MLLSDGTYSDLRLDSQLFLSKKGGWRKFAFNKKEYDTKNGRKQTLVCASLENTVREIIKSTGIQGGSSHSGRRSLVTWMDREDYDLELMRRILGYSDPEVTLTYIDPWMKRIEPHIRTCGKG